MLKVSETRRFEVKIDGEWTPAFMSQLEPGDIIRIREPHTDSLVEWHGETEFIVEKRPTVLVDLVSTVDRKMTG